MIFTNFLFSILGLVLVLGVLIFVHELGHFLAAKAFKVRVDVFSLGFGPRLLGFRRGETDYRISAIPLGGYVRMAGELGPSELSEPTDPGHFTAKPRWQRLIIMVAGASMNIVLAIVVWWGLFMVGTQQLDIPQGPPVVEAAEPGSPAERAGLQPGDKILAIGGAPIDSIEAYGDALLLNPNQKLTYTIERGAARREVTVETRARPRFGTGWDGVRPRYPILISLVTPDGPAAKAGVKVGDRILEIDGRAPGGLESVSQLITKGTGDVVLSVLRDGQTLAFSIAPTSERKVGIGVSWPMKHVRYGFVEAGRQSLGTAWYQAGVLFRTLGALLQRRVGMDVMSGPIEIAKISGQQVQLGLLQTLAFLAFISLQLGIFNLLPIPVLDGGHILILLIESAMRRDVSLAVKERVLQVGFVLLVVFAAVVIFKDIGKQFRGAAENPPPAAEQPAPAK